MAKQKGIGFRLRGQGQVRRELLATDTESERQEPWKLVPFGSKAGSRVCFHRLCIRL